MTAKLRNQRWNENMGSHMALKRNADMIHERVLPWSTCAFAVRGINW